MTWHCTLLTQHSIYWRKLAKAGGIIAGTQCSSACLRESQSLKLTQGQRETLWSLKDHDHDAPALSLPLCLSFVVPAIRYGKILVSCPGPPSQHSWLSEGQGDNL